jgi:hypothetical protein
LFSYVKKVKKSTSPGSLLVQMRARWFENSALAKNNGSTAAEGRDDDGQGAARNRETPD